MKHSPLLGLVVAASTLASAVQAQSVTTNEQKFGICAGSQLSSFSAWMAVAVGQPCNSSSSGNEWSAGTADWSFNDGAADFDDLYYTRIKRESDGPIVSQEPPVAVFTKDNGPNGNGPQGIGQLGNGPDGNGPPGNGPHGNGPPGNGPDGNGPPGRGPDGNGPPGPPSTNLGSSGGDPVDDLVNQTNAAPEPATMLLVASGLAGVGAIARRRRKNAKKDLDA